uniref:DNA (cytosine-5-)-methyltransferase n=1 Tax=Candidatus Merdicola sp. TaxID=3085652 RepID=UPI003FEF4F48
MKEYKVGSLFAGVGGICLGFQNAKGKNACYKLLWANEIDEYACATYKNNFHHKLLQGDIKLVLHPEFAKNDQEKKYYENLHEIILKEPIDILNGGFPCQAFSIAGEQKGFDDERGNLFLNIIDLIEMLGEKFYKPRVLFLENVKNLQAHDNGRTYKVIKEKLEECGYKIFEKVLNTMEYSDLPQNRERIYIIGLANEKDIELFDIYNKDVLSNLCKHKSSEERVSDIKKIINYDLTKENAEKYYYTKEKYPNYFVSLDEFKNSEKENRINLDEQIDEMYQFYQCRRGMYVRKNKSGVCPTLTANMGTGGHNVPLIKVSDGIRKLTPTETFKLQGFPVGNGYKLPEEFNGKKYPDSQLYKQAGNAVSVPVITTLSEEILKILEKNDNT